MRAVNETIERMGLICREPRRAALFPAGRASVKFRGEGGAMINLLAGFFIGARAAMRTCGILARNGRRFRNHLPCVTLVAPERRIEP